jgi:hypothetical protein
MLRSGAVKSTMATIKRPGEVRSIGTPFRESSDRTPRREDNNGRDYIELFSIWFFAVAAESPLRNHPAAMVS